MESSMIKKQERSTWTFLTNHAHVLLCLAKSPSRLMRDIAEEVGITERAVQRIIADLQEGAYITKIRRGRSNTYEINTEKHLKHPIEAHKTLLDLIELIYED
jgi:DNA-binding MarR family transcriptional regulator